MRERSGSFGGRSPACATHSCCREWPGAARATQFSSCSDLATPRDLRARTARRAQPDWYSKDDRATTETETLVLALLLQSYHEKEAVVAWSKAVGDDAHSFSVGAEWKPPSTWSTTKRHIHRDFKQFAHADVTALRRKTVVMAAGCFDGPGRRRHMCEHDVGDYRKALFHTDSAAALLGLGGGATARKGAPLRRAYILPRVARLLVEQRARLDSALEAGVELALERVNDDDVSGKAVRSAKKSALKRQLAEKDDEAAERDEKLRLEVRAVSLRRACAKSGFIVESSRALARASPGGTPAVSPACRCSCTWSPIHRIRKRAS